LKGKTKKRKAALTRKGEERREQTKERRDERRAAVAREREERLKELQVAAKGRTRKSFTAKARKGDKAKLDFTFSGLPVPVDHPDDPDGKALVRHTEMVQALAERDGQSSKDN